MRWQGAFFDGRVKMVKPGEDLPEHISAPRKGHRPSYPNGFISSWAADLFPEGYKGHAIDVGASDGISISSTYVLEKWAGWHVLCVEANPFFKPFLKQSRMFVEMCACGAEPMDEATFYVNEVRPEAWSALQITPGFRERAKVLKTKGEGVEWSSHKVRVDTVDRLLTKWGFPKLDVLFVDVEGHETAVLQGAALDKWKPKAMVVENWKAGFTDDYLKGFGYKRVARSVDNDFYVRND